MSAPGGGGANRIAIKFGGAPSSSSSKTAATRTSASRPRPPPSALGKRSRAHPWGHDDDDDSGSEGGETTRGGGAGEAITGFGSSGAEVARDQDEEEARREKQNRELVIKPLKNRDWRAEKRRRGPPRDGGGGEDGVVREAERAPAADGERDIVWGLNVPARASGDSAAAKGGDAADGDEEEEEDEKGGGARAAAAPATADQEAIDALLGRAEAKETPVIPSSRRDEDSAYREAVSEAGAAPTLADYEKMPVEDFGAALLRGMGWDGKMRGQQKERARRAKGLGLGATEMEGMAGGKSKGGQAGARGAQKRVTLSEYNRERERERGAEGARGDSYKRERERERNRAREHRGRDGERERDRHRNADRDRDRHRHRHREHDRRR